MRYLDSANLANAYVSGYVRSPRYIAPVIYLDGILTRIQEDLRIEGLHILWIVSVCSRVLIQPQGNEYTYVRSRKP